MSQDRYDITSTQHKVHKTRTTDRRCASTRAMILVLTIDDGMELGWLDGTDEGFGFDDKARDGR